MKQLLGAIINNFLLMNTKLTQLYLITIPGTIALYVTTRNSGAAQLMPFFIVLGVPVASLENSAVPFSTRWKSFENTWALSPHLMVISRYLLFILLSTAGLVVWAILPFEFYGGQFTLTHFVIAGQLMCIAYYPIVYLLNPKQESLGIIILFSSIGLSLALTFGLDRFAGDNYFLMAAVVAAMYIISATLSCMFNAVHRGRVA